MIFVSENHPAIAPSRLAAGGPRGNLVPFSSSHHADGYLYHQPSNNSGYNSVISLTRFNIFADCRLPLHLCECIAIAGFNARGFSHDDRWRADWRMPRSSSARFHLGMFIR